MNRHRRENIKSHVRKTCVMQDPRMQLLLPSTQLQVELQWSENVSGQVD